MRKQIFYLHPVNDTKPSATFTSMLGIVSNNGRKRSVVNFRYIGVWSQTQYEARCQVQYSVGLTSNDGRMWSWLTSDALAIDLKHYTSR